MTGRPDFDAAVVGAGPAGSATAALLAQRGCHVLLLERARFPRAKPCAEYLSPEAARVLDRLGVLAAVEAEGPARLAGMKVVSPQGTPFTGRFRGVHRYRGYRDYGLALPREVLDAHLAQAAVRCGAKLREGTAVEGFAGGREDVVELGLRCNGARDTVTVRVVVGADGLNSRIASRLGVVRRGRRRRMALVTHATDVTGMEDVGEMHVGPWGYVGLAPVGRGLTNVAVVADVGRGSVQVPPKAWFHRLLERVPAVAARLSRATFVDPIRVVGPFARRTVRATDDRVVLVGDAADFCDPFTGEGIYAALRGAELAVDVLVPALEHDRLRSIDLAPYDAARRREFGGKWIVERLVSWAVAHPAVFNRVARRLAERPSLADLLVGVTGDFIPASEILKPSYMWRLVG